jgi:hypothetical protein
MFKLSNSITYHLGKRIGTISEYDCAILKNKLAAYRSDQYDNTPIEVLRKLILRDVVDLFADEALFKGCSNRFTLFREIYEEIEEADYDTETIPSDYYQCKYCNNYCKDGNKDSGMCQTCQDIDDDLEPDY